MYIKYDVYIRDVTFSFVDVSFCGYGDVSNFYLCIIY